MARAVRRIVQRLGRIDRQVLNPAAAPTHEVIVWRRGGIVVQRARAQLCGADLALLHEPLQVAVDGAEADRRQHAPHAIIDALRRRVLRAGGPHRLQHDG